MVDRDVIVAALPTYEIGEELGQGAFGVVYAGRQVTLGRDVAIKWLGERYSADPETRRRFVNEARLLGALDHPHVVPIYDFVDADGLLLLVMERLPGGTLSDRVRPMAPQVACGVVVAACAGLHHAHGRGVLHRDVKPENLMFAAGGIVKVTDFGIAKVVGGAGTVMTEMGSVLGTPAYMAPEQAQALDLSPATDVYAVGTVLYELLSGTLPHPVAEPLMALYQRIHHDPIPLVAAAPAIPPELAAAVDKAIARDPADRFESAELLGEALARGAGAAWGPGWVEEAGVPVLASGRIAKALASDLPVRSSPPTPTMEAAVTLLAPPVATDTVDDPADAGDPRRRSRSRWAISRLWLLLALVIVAGGIGIAVFVSAGRGRNAANPANTTSSAPASTAAGTAPPAGPVPPAAGAPPPPGVALGVQIAPLSVEPGCRAPSTGRGAAWQRGPVQLGGRSYDVAFYCNVFPGGQGSLEFDLGGSYKDLTLTIGLADKLSSTRGKVTFEFIGDGRESLTPPQTLEYGKVLPVTFDVTNVTRLTFKVSEVGESSGADSATVPVLGAPTVTRAS